MIGCWVWFDGSKKTQELQKKTERTGPFDERHGTPRPPHYTAESDTHFISLVLLEDLGGGLVLLLLGGLAAVGGEKVHGDTRECAAATLSPDGGQTHRDELSTCNKPGRAGTMASTAVGMIPRPHDGSRLGVGGFLGSGTGAGGRGEGAAHG